VHMLENNRVFLGENNGFFWENNVFFKFLKEAMFF